MVVRGGMFVVGCLCLGLTGCATATFSKKADNIHLATPTLPSSVRRVVVLPLACASGSVNLSAGCESLTPVLFEEFCKTKKFEAVKISEDEMKALVGQACWSGDETLPVNFLKSLKDTCGCDAVLFSELTTFRPYAPVAVGWRFKLVDVQTRQILWAADEVFDTAHPPATTLAKHWARESIAGFYQVQADDWTDFHSPIRVGRSSAALLLATLPTRQ